MKDSTKSLLLFSLGSFVVVIIIIIIIIIVWCT